MPVLYDIFPLACRRFLAPQQCMCTKHLMNAMSYTLI